jgi:aconitate hydratase
VAGTEGGFTTTAPGGEVVPIYEAAMRYQEQGTPLVILAGKEYGTGSSRDWAAKGTVLLGVRVVVAESFERIHRSNLVGMGVLPCEFADGQTRQTLGLTGFETYRVEGLTDALRPRQRLTMVATGEGGRETRFEVMARIDTPEELRYYKHGGILPYVLRSLVGRTA